MLHQQTSGNATRPTHNITSVVLNINFTVVLDIHAVGQTLMSLGKTEYPKDADQFKLLGDGGQRYPGDLEQQTHWARH